MEELHNQSGFDLLLKQNHLGGGVAWYIGSETPDI